MRRILAYHWRAIFWIIIICIGCLLPSDNLPSTGSFISRLSERISLFVPFDKVIHFLIYFIFMLVLVAGFMRQFGGVDVKVPSWKAYLVSFVIAVSCGVAIEFIQDAVGRSCDTMDMLANTLGALTGAISFKPIRWILHNIL